VGVPRPLRIEYLGAVYHVMNRGQSRRNIFIEDQAAHESRVAHIGCGVFDKGRSETVTSQPEKVVPKLRDRTVFLLAVGML
jgi:hypothetical protein